MTRRLRPGAVALLRPDDVLCVVQELLPRRRARVLVLTAYERVVHRDRLELA